MPSKSQLETEVQLIAHWLRDTTEPFDNWDWNGQDLTIYLNNEPVEKYTRETLAEVIPGFPSTPQPVATESGRLFNLSQHQQ